MRRYKIVEVKVDMSYEKGIEGLLNIEAEQGWRIVSMNAVRDMEGRYIYKALVTFEKRT